MATTHPREILQAGDRQRKQGDFEQAIALYEQVADGYRDDARTDKALVVYRHVFGIVQAHGLSHHLVRIALHLAEAAAALDQRAEALAAYDAAAVQLRAEGRIHEALDAYHSMRDLEPSNPLVNVRLAECHADLGDVAGAIPLLGYAAVRMRAHGRLDEALVVLERLLALRNDPRYARVAAEIHLQRGGERDALEALRKLEHAYQADREDLAVLELLARAFEAVGHAGRAETVRAEAARIAVSRDASGEARRDSAADHASEIEGEITDLLSRATITVPVDEDALWRADALAYDGRYDEARVILEALSRIAPRHRLVQELSARVERLAARRQRLAGEPPEICPVPASSVPPRTGVRRVDPSAYRPLERTDVHDETPPNTQRAWPPSQPDLRESATVPSRRRTLTSVA